MTKHKVPRPEHKKKSPLENVGVKPRWLVIYNADGTILHKGPIIADGKGVELAKKLESFGFVRDNDRRWTHPEGRTYEKKFMYVENRKKTPVEEIYRALGIDPKVGTGATQPQAYGPHR